MKIYEALKEMVENKKIIKRPEFDTLYKYQRFDDIDPLILEKRENHNNWESTSFFISSNYMEEEWEISKGEK